METKTYFANSVQAAMEVAGRELGPDAMLVGSAPAPEAARPFGRLEVTFAWDGFKSPRSGVPANNGIRVDDAPGRRGESGLEQIRLEISALRAAIGRDGNSSLRAVDEPAGAVDSEAFRTLCENGFEKDTARGIAEAAENGAGSILLELTARIPAAVFAPLEADESRTLAFIGPPGRGKTASLVKIAMRYGIANRIPTRIFTAGAQGVGACDQMARYAAILGVPFQAVDSYDSLNLILQGERWKGLALIDTSGLALAERREMEAMTKFFARRPDIEKHLVIRAEARSADMQYMVARFDAIRPSRLLFTGVDEARTLGAAADTMIRSGMAAAFFGTGPNIPEDLEAVSVPKLARSLWTAGGLAAKAA